MEPFGFENQRILLHTGSGSWPAVTHSPRDDVGGLFVQKGTHFKDVDVAVCTIERANALVNVMMTTHSSNPKQLKDLDCLAAVIVDEIHLLGDPSR
jgi:hypothetical protein